MSTVGDFLAELSCSDLNVSSRLNITTGNATLGGFSDVFQGRLGGESGATQLQTRHSLCTSEDSRGADTQSGLAWLAAKTGSPQLEDANQV